MWVFIAGSPWRYLPGLHQLEITQPSHQMPWSFDLPLANLSLEGLPCFPGCSYGFHSVKEFPPIPYCLLTSTPPPATHLLHHFFEGSPVSETHISSSKLTGIPLWNNLLHLSWSYHTFYNHETHLICIRTPHTWGQSQLRAVVPKVLWGTEAHRISLQPKLLSFAYSIK